MWQWSQPWYYLRVTLCNVYHKLLYFPLLVYDEAIVEYDEWHPISNIVVVGNFVLVEKKSIYKIENLQYQLTLLLICIAS